MLEKKVFPFLPSRDHSLGYLNASQFFGVLNDNIFKLVIVFFLIEIIGHQKASSILSLAGALFVIPFLLFSSAAGILADRLSKQRLLMAMKIAEMFIMALAIFGFYNKSIMGSYALLFLLATHSATFGPSKYGIIPELVSKEKISKANGLITGFTYLATIVGTFFASFLTDITHRNFPLVASFCFLIAVLGFFSTLKIRYTSPQGSKKKISPLFIEEIAKTILSTRKIRHLSISIFGAAFFLFIGAFTQLNVIPFAIQSLSLSEVAGGYLFLSTAFGIAIGAFLAGRASKKRIELGLPVYASFCIALLFFLLALFSNHLISVVIILLLMGICGGLFIVPFDTFIQMESPSLQRGQTIAASNFLSFVGVLLSSFALYFFSTTCSLSASQGFIIMGFITLVAFAFFSCRLSDLVLSYFSKKIIQPWLHVRLETPPSDALSAPLLILERMNWLKALILLSVIPNLHLIAIRDKKRKFPWFNHLFFSIHLFSQEDSPKLLLEKAAALIDEKMGVCLLIKEKWHNPPKEDFLTPFKEFLHRRKAAFSVEIDFSQRKKKGVFSLFDSHPTIVRLPEIDKI